MTDLPINDETNPTGIRGFVRRINDQWLTRPLSTRLVAMMLSLLAIGLSLTGTVMITLLHRHLIGQIDEQLFTSASSLAQQTSQIRPSSDSPLPSLFYIRRSIVGQPDEVHYSSQTLAMAGRPRIPVLIEVGKEAPTESGWTNPITVDSDQPGKPWRTIAVPLVLSNTDTPVGVMTLALPLNDVHRTLQITTLYVLTTGAIILLLGGSFGHYMVRRSLLPLRDIESTAGKIAAGDLTQRVVSYPSTTEVGSLSQSLNIMLSQVESSFAAREETERKIRRFVSDASHELRTPLAAISGYCELYAMGGVPDDRVSEVVGRVQSEASRMGNLVEDLLTLARLDEGRPLEIIDVDIVRMAEHAAFDLQALDPNRTVGVISLNSTRAPEPLTVQADRDQLQQVFTNLVGNIIRYTPEGTPVELALGQQGKNAVIEFRDHGPGIAEKDQEKVFERFYRTENSRSRSLGGSGLGLAIVSSIVDAHFGSAQLKKTPGGGVTARIELPMTSPLATRTDQNSSEDNHTR